jgi:hypothetical protein
MTQYFFHGSYDFLAVGVVLKPKENYKEIWSKADFYCVLEKYRPEHMLAHHESVFMCDNIDDIDNAGGGTDWIFTVHPHARIEKHDLYWCSEISLGVSEGKEEEFLKDMAKKYWNGIKSEYPVWEYLTPEAIIVNVEKY